MATGLVEVRPKSNKTVISALGECLQESIKQSMLISKSTQSGIRLFIDVYGMFN